MNPTTTRAAIAQLPRSVRSVVLPGGGAVHVRDVSLAELQQIDRRAEELPEGLGRNIRRAVLLCLYALAEPDGAAAFPEATEEDVKAIESLTPRQMEAIAAAAVPDKDSAKNA